MATQLPSQKRSEGQREEWRRRRDHKHYSQHVMRNKEQHWRVRLRSDDPVLIRLANIAVSADLRWCWKNEEGNAAQPTVATHEFTKTPGCREVGPDSVHHAFVLFVSSRRERSAHRLSNSGRFCIIGCSAATNILYLVVRSSRQGALFQPVSGFRLKASMLISHIHSFGLRFIHVSLTWLFSPP